MLPTRSDLLACAIAVVVLLVGCSSGGGNHAAATTTLATTTTAATSTTISPSRVVANLGACPQGLPVLTAGSNTGITGLAKRLVPITARTVRVCMYDYLNGRVVSESATSANPNVADLLEAVTNGVPNQLGQRSCFPTTPTGSTLQVFFVTFANETQRVDVSESLGCPGYASNGSFIAAYSFPWVDRLFSFIINNPPRPRPTPVTQVPKVLPSNGVVVRNEWILLPPAPTDRPLITRAEALDIARSYMNPQSGPFTEVLLARFTAVSEYTNSSVTLPSDPNVSVDVRALRNLLTWVIVQTYPRPENVGQGPQPFYATHAVTEISANDGRFFRGSFTP